MADELRAGMRVRLRAPSPILTFSSGAGQVVGPARYDGYYVIHLEEPARYESSTGKPIVLAEVVEAADNLDVL